MSNPDVVIIGGGLIGLLTAAELAERGARVVILEKDDLGFEQSGRSVAAVNLPGGKPNDETAAMLRSSAEEWASFEDRWQCQIDLNAEGWHIVIENEEDEAWLETERATWKTTAGFPESKLLDSQSARERFPQFEGHFLGLDVRHGGHADAVMVISGLRQATTRLGVEIRCGVLATGFHVSGETITGVATSTGVVECGSVIAAAGVWSQRLCGCLGLHIPMQRVRAPAVETCPMPTNLIPGFVRGASFGARQNRNGTIRITGGYRFSAMLHDLSFNDLHDLRTWGPALWQNRKDISLRLNPRILKAELGSTLARVRGGRDREATVPTAYEPPSSRRARDDQLRALARLIPALRTARVHRSFSGVMDLLPDLQPVIGRIPGTSNAYVSTGFSGHGYMYGPGACKALAGLISENDPGISLHAYRPERLQERLKMREQIF